jgi:hypothetical protein
MAEHVAAPATATQRRFPWRTTVRTSFQAGVALAAGAPFIYQAATNHDPAAATGAAGAALAVAAGITRVMALPVVDKFIRRFLPFLAPDNKGTP